MISYVTYKLVHYIGIFTVVSALAAYFAQAAVGGSPLVRGPWARRLVAAHGIGLFLILLGGFGMLARLGVTTGLVLPTWIWIKLAIWVALGGFVALARRRPEFSGRLLVALPVLAVVAGAVALMKPFQ